MKIQLNRKPMGYVWLLCFGIVGVVILGGIMVYVIIRACDHIPPPEPPRAGDTNDYNIVSLKILAAPRQGSGFVHAALVHNDGTNFTLQIFQHENTLSSRPVVYWLTGVVNHATGGADVKAYNDDGQVLSTNQFERAQ